MATEDSTTDTTADWTVEPPSTEGYYWWRDESRRRCDVVSVWLQGYWKPGEEPQLLCRLGNRDPVRVFKMGGEWWPVRLTEPAKHEHLWILKDPAYNDRDDRCSICGEIRPEGTCTDFGRDHHWIPATIDGWSGQWCTRCASRS